MSNNSADDQVVEKIKEWWKQFGHSLIGCLLIASLGIGGVKYWDKVQADRSKDAAATFESILQFLNKGQKDKAKDLILTIKKDYPELTYSHMAQLLEAHIFVSEGNYIKAEKSLKEVLDNDNFSGLSEIAGGRLARIYLAQNRIEEAKKIISRVEDIFENSSLELRGDIAAAEGDIETANSLYQRALIQSELLGYPTQNIILKRNNISIRKAF